MSTSGSSHRAGVYIRQSTGYRAFISAPLPLQPLLALTRELTGSLPLMVNVEHGGAPILRFLLPDGDERPITIEVSCLLHQLNRQACVEVLSAVRGVPTLATSLQEEKESNNAN